MVILVSLPTAFLFNLYGTLLCAFGRANVALMELVTAVTINIALDYCFVAKLRWRHRGRGVGTAASQAISTVVCILYLRRSASELLFRREDCRMDHALLRRMVHFSFVTGLHQPGLYTADSWRPCESGCRRSVAR